METFLKARQASRKLKTATSKQKNEAIIAVSNAIRANIDNVLQANAQDVLIQKQSGATDAFIDRLKLTEERINAICDDMLSVAKLPDPVGEILSEFQTASGLKIQKVAVPFGVIGVIFESRPNVTVDVFTLCLKTGNACILKGGKEAAFSNNILVEIIKKALYNTVISPESVQLLPSDRVSTAKLITAKGLVDLIIPRGGKGLIQYVAENSLVPVIETGAGVCHTYVEKTADFDTAIKIVINAKTSRPSVCNAMETLLVDRDIAKDFLSKLSARMPEVVMHGGDEENALLKMSPLTETGYRTEYSSLDLSVKIVDGVEQAIEHINDNGTHHSDAIISTDSTVIEQFLNNIDSACVYANASTRFSDGGCFGFGAELGISTQKLHARGPMGLKEMTSYQYKIYGEGQTR
ncbi:MAG: glutamate-5-semialdehyde dehydrogenase [Christensenellaceae bacterium]